jgi:MYXO-CTERM domain-containing protein
MRTMEERQEKPHDVLAAEEFGIGTRDDRYPGDPTGIQEPHDVLAAEEFAMPAPGDVAPGEGVGVRNLVPPILMVALVALLVLRRRRS